jgi:hypothetical protein
VSKDKRPKEETPGTVAYKSYQFGDSGEAPAFDPELTVHKAMEVLIRGRALAWRWAAEGKIECSKDGLRKVKLSDILRAIQEAATR